MRFPGESRGLLFRGTSPSLLARHQDCLKKSRVVEEWVPAFAGKAREDLLIAFQARFLHMLTRGEGAERTEAGEGSLVSNREN